MPHWSVVLEIVDREEDSCAPASDMCCNDDSDDDSEGDDGHGYGRSEDYSINSLAVFGAAHLCGRMCIMCWW